MIRSKKLIPLLTSLLLLALALTLTSCKSGGTTEKTSGPAADHYHEYIDNIFPPTCVAEGFTSHTCHICQDTYFDTYVPMLDHTYTDTVTPPACGVGGYTTHTCSVCGYSYNDTETAPLEHFYNEAIVDPTCIAEGYTEHICVHCSHKYTDTPTPTVDHQHISTVVPPTGTEKGYTEHTCAVCGDSYRDTYTDPLDRQAIVTFDPNGGTMEGYPTAMYRTGEHVDLPTPTMEGHVFDGWYADPEDEATLVESGIWTSADGMHLTACWSPITVEIQFHMGDGGASLAYGYHTVAWGEPIGALAIPRAKFGYTFDGWYDGDTRITEETVSCYTEPVTLIGKWLAPLAADHVSGGDTNDYDWAVYADGTLRFSPETGADGGSASFTIDNGTFRGMAEITAVELPDTLTDIGQYAFADCTNLKTVTFPGSAGVIRSSVFEGCTALEAVTVGSGISVINQDAFRGCAALSEITLPLSLYQIYSPFEGCTSLAHVRYEGSEFQWGVVLKDPSALAAFTAEGVTFTYQTAFPER